MKWVVKTGRFSFCLSLLLGHNDAVKLQGKIFLQFLAAWLFMPVGLFVAQWSGIAQLPEFIASILLIASVGPIQIYVNEIFAPIAVCQDGKLNALRVAEVCLGISFLSVWACYSMHLAWTDYLFCLCGALGLVWVSFETAKRVLLLQTSAVIGGRYSFVVGALPSIIFLILVVVFWGLKSIDQLAGGAMYLLVILPTLVQYGYSRIKWPADIASVSASTKTDLAFRDNAKFLTITILLAAISQYWKVQLIVLAAGYAALSVYLISPVSSLWLVYSKARYVNGLNRRPLWTLWLGPLLLPLSLVVAPESWGIAFVLAFVGQVIAFKFITDARQCLALARPI